MSHIWSTVIDPDLDLLAILEVGHLGLGPQGKLGWAAVSLFWSKVSPLAVSLPCNPGPYQDASHLLVGRLG